MMGLANPTINLFPNDFIFIVFFKHHILFICYLYLLSINHYNTNINYVLSFDFYHPLYNQSILLLKMAKKKPTTVKSVDSRSKRVAKGEKIGKI